MEVNSGNTPRKKLADISNLPLRKRFSSQDKKPENIPIASKEYIEKIQKENLSLTKMLAERNKIIEITGVEIEKLRINVRKMQQQNQQLARANSKMLAELNSDKDRVKTLQHELGCIKGLVNARKLEAEEQPKTKMCQNLNDEIHKLDEVKPMKCEEAEDLSLRNGDNEKARNFKKRPQSKSVGSSEQVQSEDKTENKRSCVRRQSARFKPEVLNLGEDSFEVQDKCAPTNDSVQENYSTSICISSNNVDCNPSSMSEPIPFGRSSLSRPSREAAKKVQSYKEIPVNIKMRRPQ